MTVIARCLVLRKFISKIDIDNRLNESFDLNLSKCLPNCTRCTVGSKWDHWRVFCNHVARCLVPHNLTPKIV